jgi:hypothetical protein
MTDDHGCRGRGNRESYACRFGDDQIVEATSSGLAATTRAWTTSPPADAYFGRADAIIKQRERIKRQTIEHRRLQHRKLAA